MRKGAPARTFVDTNVFVYAVTVDSPEKAARARHVTRALIEVRSGVISTQIMKEYYSVLAHKLMVPKPEARRLVMDLEDFEVIPDTAELVESAIDLTMSYSISIWDAMLVAAAVSSGCDRLLSEDLPHGSTISGVRIENPFN